MSARLLFIACWTFADDQGGLDRSAKQLKAQAFPYDVIDCEPLIQELLGKRLLIEYEVSGKNYLHINGFLKHQKIENPSKARIPPYHESKNNHRELTENSPSPQGPLIGGESKGRESRGSKTCPAATPPARAKTPAACEAQPGWWLDFKRAYPDRAGDQNWRGAIRAAHARLTEGHKPEEFIAGANRYAAYLQAIGKVRTEFVKQAATFLGPAKPFLEPWTLPNTKADTRLNSNLSAAEDFLRRTENAA